MTRPTHDWIPERHLGAAATLAHADELIGQIGDLLFDYQAQPGGTFTLREVAAGSVSRTEVGHIAPIPRKVSLLVADALVALRAALEHALFAEVEFLEGGQLDERAAKLVEIPASDTYEKFDEWMRRRAKNGPPSLRAGSELVRRIEGIQPFQRVNEPHSHPLARLTIHTNHAKHRTPAITAVRLAAMYRDDQLPRSMGDLPTRPEEPIRVGDVIAETPLGTKVPVTLFPTVGINRPGTDRWPVLMTELDEISWWVRTQAVPRLITGGDLPEPALPTRYEISVGQEDERAAIAAGSMISAPERHKQRLGAANARPGLVDLIGQIKGAPSVSDITAWAEHLTDEEVLERMSRLRKTFTYQPETLLRNADVVAALLDEVLNFAFDDDPAEAR
ncbi:hypothetical protein OIE71_06160 [Streptomyces sp. NBC_01725]|uniref:hypothetical protein n=1 Tax=Streptomyces sp. NBC_01725 TaxID=2975923 RepID=UPI002E27E2B8|nr:hypothetical protein [Streptomyces sp. NBC_01725]